MKNIVYKIINLNDGKFYVGSTTNFKNRKAQHFRTLKNGTHHCIFLQRAYNKHKEHSFSIEVVETFDREEECREFEQKFLDEHYDSLYNTSKNSSGGDLISYHPDKERICAQISETLKTKISFLTELERKDRFANIGCKNGMYGKNHSDKTKSLISKIILSRNSILPNKLKGKTFEDIYGEEVAKIKRENLSKKAKTRTGDKNSFYGKKHSEETRKRMSEKAKNRKTFYSKKVCVNGKIYNSCKQASEDLNISSSLLCHRIRSDNEKYKDYFYYNA